MISNSTVSDEIRIISAENPNEKPIVFQERQRNLEYEIDHIHDKFYIRTNLNKARNFQLMWTSEENTSLKNWNVLIPVRQKVFLGRVEFFDKFMAVEERENGLNRIVIHFWDQDDFHIIPINEETYNLHIDSNPDPNSKTLRYSYSSLTTPQTIIDYNVFDKTREIKKEQEVLGEEFSKENYKSERVWANSRDGIKIPISLVYHKKTKLGEDTPLLLYGYGSYGFTVDPSFNSNILSLLNRGFVFAIAHIRGGQYLGRKWYEDGKMYKKKNTFYDFIDVAKFLIHQNYTSREHCYALGGSAGGLLMGVVINEEPELFKGVIAEVPFVDVVTTMLDETIPLTTFEYDEWGNPNDKKAYEYMMSYSPYDNVEKKNYPNILVNSGYHDSQVQYWEPTKWVAKLREYTKSDNKILLYTNMDAGHGGASGRFNYLKEIARNYSFLFMLENVKK